jgi:hypothetical protein
MLQQACGGELRKVDKPLYWKNFGDHNTHVKWRDIPQEQLRTAWHSHCQQMGKIATRRIGNSDLVTELVTHRLDARRVREMPKYLKDAML